MKDSTLSARLVTCSSLALALLGAGGFVIGSTLVAAGAFPVLAPLVLSFVARSQAHAP